MWRAIVALCALAARAAHVGEGLTCMKQLAGLLRDMQEKSEAMPTEAPAQLATFMAAFEMLTPSSVVGVTCLESNEHLWAALEALFGASPIAAAFCPSFEAIRRIFLPTHRLAEQHSFVEVPVAEPMPHQRQAMQRHAKA